MFALVRNVLNWWNQCVCNPDRQTLPSDHKSVASHSAFFSIGVISGCRTKCCELTILQDCAAASSLLTAVCFFWELSSHFFYLCFLLIFAGSLYNIHNINHAHGKIVLRGIQRVLTRRLSICDNWDSSQHCEDALWGSITYLELCQRQYFKLYPLAAACNACFWFFWVSSFISVISHSVLLNAAQLLELTDLPLICLDWGRNFN